MLEMGQKNVAPSRAKVGAEDAMLGLKTLLRLEWLRDELRREGMGAVGLGSLN